MADDQQTHDTKVPGSHSTSSNDDLLAELREKTARLAEQIRGTQEQPKHVLEIETAKQEDEKAIAALMVGPEKETSKGSTKRIIAVPSADPAVELVRQKLSKIYAHEPDTDREIDEVTHISHRSKHQQFMYQLTTSGKSLAEIQTEWHHYYTALPDDEKHQVWHEFYENQRETSKLAQHREKATHKHKEEKKSSQHVERQFIMRPSGLEDKRTIADIKTQLYDKISAGGTLKPIHHLKSLFFGLAMAGLVGLILTFTFFNEVFIAPFISPASAVSTTPIIGEQSSEVGPEPKIIIPKINLEVPVVYDMNTVEEADVQKALEQGVVHYASTPNPGEQGNVVIVGHSSNNILNSGKYKFAFVLLKRLESEDVFFIQKDRVRYTYKVYKKEIVAPNDVSVLDTQDRANTITLITCDPPGTSLNRLIIVAEQISPDPSGNKSSTAIKESSAKSTLPSNAPSLWSRLWPF